MAPPRRGHGVWLAGLAELAGAGPAVGPLHRCRQRAPSGPGGRDARPHRAAVRRAGGAGGQRHLAGRRRWVVRAAPADPSRRRPAGIGDAGAGRRPGDVLGRLAGGRRGRVRGLRHLPVRLRGRRPPPSDGRRPAPLAWRHPSPSRTSTPGSARPRSWPAWCSTSAWRRSWAAWSSWWWCGRRARPTGGPAPSSGSRRGRGHRRPRSWPLLQLAVASGAAVTDVIAPARVGDLLHSGSAGSPSPASSCSAWRAPWLGSCCRRAPGGRLMGLAAGRHRRRARRAADPRARWATAPPPAPSGCRPASSTWRR